MKILKQGKRRCLRAPSRHPREAIGVVADQGEIVGDRLGFYAEFFDDAGFIAQNIAAAVELHDPISYDALTEIFVWGTDEHLSHAIVLGCFGGGGGEGIVRLIFDHGPHDDSHGFEPLLEKRELGEQLGRNAFAGFVSGIEIVAESFLTWSVATPRWVAPRSIMDKTEVRTPRTAAISWPFRSAAAGTAKK